jgi:hypothetical protein
MKLLITLTCENTLKKTAKIRKQQSKATLNAQIEAIITQATEQTSESLNAVEKQSKRSRIVFLKYSPA